MLIHLILFIISVIFIHNTHKTKKLIIPVLLINLCYLLYIIYYTSNHITIIGITSAPYDAFVLKEVFPNIILFILITIYAFYIYIKR